LSEAEWEYAARAGTTTKYSCGNGEGCLGGVAWYSASSGGRTYPVGSKGANAFGLHDMHGNVWEWTEDCRHGNYNGAPSDGGAWTTGGNCSWRVLRGGSWLNTPRFLSSAFRNEVPSVIQDHISGFRVARTLTFDKPKKTQIAVAHPKVLPPKLPKPSLPTAKSRDTTPPTITIASAITVKTDNPTIQGRATDNTQVAQVTFEGVAADLKSDGSFSFPYYVPSNGTSVKIEAVDKWGNRSERTVKITRAVIKTTDQFTFSRLNPTKIKGRSNKDAIALIIGVANYSRAPTATFADNDANVFGDFAHRALGIPRSNIKVLVNDKATLTDLKVGVKRWLRGRIEEGKTDVHVFFAGHGLASPDGKDLYLLPYGGETSLLDETALLRREMFEVIDKAKPKSATIFLDTCYSGLSRGKETLLASARGIVVTARPQSIPKGFTVLSAASGQQISSGLDAAKHGLFSYYLMKGMEGGADANRDRKITAGELHAYLGKRVQKQAVRLGREQTPELSGDGERVLVRW